MIATRWCKPTGVLRWSAGSFETCRDGKSTGPLKDLRSNGKGLVESTEPEGAVLAMLVEPVKQWVISELTVEIH